MCLFTPVMIRLLTRSSSRLWSPRPGPLFPPAIWRRIKAGEQEALQVSN